MSRVIVLMYHALYSSIDELHAMRDEEQPYAVSVTTFERHMDTLINAGIPILSAKQFSTEEVQCSGTNVLLTFDDGHRSFHEHAFPALSNRSLSAIFFVTTDFIHSRNDSCSWAQLAEMTKQGMCVQSHGQTHRFLSDLSPELVHKELSVSKKQIEDRIGETVSMVSFPGGRFNKRDLEIGQSLDYRLFFTSRIGANVRRNPGGVQTIRRLPVKAASADRVIRMIVENNRTALGLWQCSALAKAVGKTLLGNSIYHGLYRRLSA
jgi:peptidoglycan/xylan/chitin deacetylase (PgdA/CDA1 family)